jgi:hypothetical protein
MKAESDAREREVLPLRFEIAEQVRKMSDLPQSHLIPDPIKLNFFANWFRRCMVRMICAIF